jgi:hypothetical protein
VDDLVVMIFNDQTFKQTDVIVPSLYSLSRPAQFSPVILVGFGKSSPTDTASYNDVLVAKESWELTQRENSNPDSPK